MYNKRPPPHTHREREREGGEGGRERERGREEGKERGGERGERDIYLGNINIHNNSVMFHMKDCDRN